MEKLNKRKTRRWREGEIYFAENDLVRMAYAVTDDPEKFDGLGLGWVPYQDTEMCVLWITAEQAKLWGDA